MRELSKLLKTDKTSRNDTFSQDPREAQEGLLPHLPTLGGIKGAEKGLKPTLGGIKKEEKS